MAKEQIKKHCGPVYYSVTIFSMIMIVITNVIYWWLPDSDLANGIEHSGADAVYVLWASTAVAALALVAYITGSFIDKAVITNSVVQKIVFAVSVLGISASAAITLAFTLFSNSLGFVAPTDSTVWHSLGFVSTASAVCFIGVNVYNFIAGKKN